MSGNVCGFADRCDGVTSYIWAEQEGTWICSLRCNGFYYALLYFDLHQFILPLIAVYMLVILAIYVLTYPNYKDKEIMAAFLHLYM